jgi:hypothetical protein
MPHRNQAEREKMEKLCSLHVIGELSALERRRLDAHLGECQECRVMLRDFEQIALLDLTAIAAGRTHGQSSIETHLQHPDRMLSRMLRQADARYRVPTPAPEAVVSAPVSAFGRRWNWLFDRSYRRLTLGWAVAGMAMIAAGYFVVQASRQVKTMKPDLSAALKHVQSEAASWKLRAEAVQTQQRLSAQQLDRSIAQNAATTATLEGLRASYSQLQQKEKMLDQQVADESTRLAQMEGDLQVTRASLDQERQHVRMLDVELQDANTNALEASERITHLTQVADTISVPASSPGPHVSDAEAREIFGARDLHIVDVYDVDRSGKTRRTYGRVYYVNRSLLLFYAFDLEDRKNNRKAAGFQAWGFREPNSSKPENLGLFYVDDASLNRWALRVSDANVLSRIDTVFVTLEPPQGSSSPRGPKLLFASLGGPANHP